MTDTVVVPAGPEHARAWLEMREALWPDSGDDHVIEIEMYLAGRPETDAVFVAQAGGRSVGFVEVGLRDYAEDCSTSPVGHIEGIYVADEARRGGVARALVVAAEEWARSIGCKEMASDREISNEVSGAFHLGVGYDETTRIVCYRKWIG